LKFCRPYFLECSLWPPFLLRWHIFSECRWWPLPSLRPSHSICQWSYLVSVQLGGSQLSSICTADHFRLKLLQRMSTSTTVPVQRGEVAGDGQAYRFEGAEGICWCNQYDPACDKSGQSKERCGPISSHKLTPRRQKCKVNQ
jgi:hypothetical protein